MDASKRTADKNQQMIYANILMQEKQLELGLLGKIIYRGGSSGGGADYTNTIGAITQGIITTPLAQQQLILNQFTRSLPVIPRVIYGYRVTTYVSGLPGPGSLVVDSMNNLYNSQTTGPIYKIDTNGSPSIFAGSTNDFTDNTFRTDAKFSSPGNMKFDSVGNLYVSDGNNNRIRKIGTNGMVTTFAGNSTAGSKDDIGTKAEFNNPSGMVFDSVGNLYVCDKNGDKIRKIGTNGAVTTFAGDGTLGTNNDKGTKARFNDPSGMTIDSAGNLYVCDAGNHRIRKIEPDGTVTTFAGSTQGPRDNVIGTNAQFNRPLSITSDSTGNLYVSDTYNNRIRKIDTTGMVTTIAGQLTPGTIDNVIGTNARFGNLFGITIDSTGNIYVCDVNNNRIRKLTPLYE